jgi:hypothetical protein
MNTDGEDSGQIKIKIMIKSRIRIGTGLDTQS